MFSSRVPVDLQPNRLTESVRRATAAGRRLIDLTITNPTRAGFDYPPATLVPLSAPAALSYDPRSMGLHEARAAVAGDYARQGLDVAPDRVVLTASTSEAYSVLFKLLCAPSHDAVLVPVPSYPLFDHLTRLDGVGSIPYRLEYHGRWTVDFDSMEAAWRPNVRAVIAVSPNNPTGSILSFEELRQLGDICARRAAALILDEVFIDYPISREAARRSCPDLDCLTFRLGGLSKSAGLPQVKLGWIAVDGPHDVVHGALERMDFICDTYLSVSTPVQVAAPSLIRDGRAIREMILERLRANEATARRLVSAYGSIELLPCEAGWSFVLRVPATRSEEALVLELLDEEGVLIHPGFFFDFPREAFLVGSLLPDPSCFEAGIGRVLERAHA
jgi:alanine-synthesizing transaminase